MLFTYLFLLMFLNKASDSKNICRRLPNGCLLESNLYSRKVGRKQKYVCSNLNANFEFDLDKLKKTTNCNTTSLATNIFDQTIYFSPNKRSIINNKFHLSELVHFIDESVGLSTGESFYLDFRNIKGFDLASFKPQPANLFWGFPILTFFSSSLSFYVNKTRIDSCEKFQAASNPTGSIFHAFPKTSLPSIIFYGMSHRTPICPLIFSRSIQALSFFNLVDTFYKTNVPRFIDLNRTSTPDIGSSVSDLYIYDFDILRLDRNLINFYVFHNLTKLYLIGEIRSLETGLMRNFRFLKELVFADLAFLKFSRRHGLSWMRDLNYGVRVNLSDISQFVAKRRKRRNVAIVFNSTAADLFEKNTFKFNSVYIRLIKWYNNLKENVYEFKKLQSASFVYFDEDFCLFKDFPFENLVVIQPKFLYFRLSPNVSESCTHLWLVRYFEIYGLLNYDYFRSLNVKKIKILREHIKACDFQKR